jgi:uncharacterized membrane protein YfcA
MDIASLLIEVLGGALVGFSLGLIGAGGAIVAIPIFTLVLGNPMKVAKVEALAVTGIIALFSGVRAALARTVDLPRFLALALPGFVGAWAGGPIGKMLSPFTQALLFSALALVAAWRMVSTQKDAPVDEPPALDRRALALASAAGLAIGVVTSVIGVGGGFLLVPALVLITRLPMKRAVGTSLLVIAANSLVGVASNLTFDQELIGQVDRSAVAIVAGCGIVGSLAGARLAARLPAVVLRRVFAAVLVLVAILMVARG